MCRLIGTDRPTDRQRGKQRDGRLSLCETRERYSDGRTSSEERIHRFTQFQTLAVLLVELFLRTISFPFPYPIDRSLYPSIHLFALHFLPPYPLILSVPVKYWLSEPYGSQRPHFTTLPQRVE